MNVAEMIKNVNAECHPIVDIDGIILRFLDRGQKVIGSKRDWFWLRQYQYSVTTTSGTSLYALSPLVDLSKVITFYSTSLPRHIPHVTEQTARRRDPGADGTGDPFQYSIVRFDPVQYQPTSASTLSIVSSAAADTTQTLMVQGLDGNNRLVKDVKTLTGTTTVTTDNSYTQVMALSLSAVTAGTITITSNSGAVTNVVIPIGTRTLSHPVVRIYNAPDSADTIYYDFTMQLPTLTATTDISIIPEQYHDVIELYAKHRVWNHLNNPGQAQAAFAEFTARVQDMERDDHRPMGIVTLDGVGDSDRFREPQLPAYFPWSD